MLIKIPPETWCGHIISESDESTVFAQETCAKDTSTTISESGESTVFAQDTYANDIHRQCTIKWLRGRQDICCILRPWQVVFLAKQNIHTAGDLLQLKSRGAEQVCKSMANWRTENGMDGHSKKACLVALHVWVRACALLKAVVEQSAEDSVPDLVEINLSEEEAGFSLLS
jgi:hypothetical protein